MVTLLRPLGGPVPKKEREVGTWEKTFILEIINDDVTSNTND